MKLCNPFLQNNLIWSLLLLLQVAACAQNGGDNGTPPPAAGALFSSPEVASDIQTSAIQEASGLVASRAHSKALWTHNDSGGEAKVYLINTDGQMVGSYFLKGVQNRDWEDIAIGPGPNPDINYIYVGEIGDNDARYEEKVIYRFPEPTSVSGPQAVDTIQNIEEIRFTYPDGMRDAETLLVDPVTKDIYVLSKRDASAHIYKAAYPQDTHQPIVLEMLGNLPIVATDIGDQIVAGDISADGKEILLKSYNKVYYWQREDPSTPLAEVLQSTPMELPYEPEAQGESITFATDNSGYYTLSEKSFLSQQQLFFYKRSE